MADEKKKYLNLEGLTTYDGKIKAVITKGDEDTLKSAKDYADGLAGNYEAAGSIVTAIDALKAAEIKDNADAIAEVKEDLGALDNLTTTAKTDVVSAINEVKTAIAAGGEAAVITMTTSTTTEGALKSYTIMQGETPVGTIDIPKDMVVESGEVVTNPDGQPEGTYIKLVLANVSKPLYINVGTLVDLYVAKASATQVQVVVDSTTREISATIVAGSVGTTELADNAITTAKIADANVTKAKLSTEVQTSLGKADVALEEAKAYADSKVAGVDLSGIATNAGEIKDIKESLAEGGATAEAIADAKKAGTDAASAVTTLETGKVADNATAIKALEDKVGEGFVAITTAEIEALFA